MSSDLNPSIPRRFSLSVCVGSDVPFSTQSNIPIVKQTDNDLYTFGNLAIIPGALNTSISNEPWDVKLAGKGAKEGMQKYAKGLVTMDEYLSQPVWNLDSIHARANKLYQQILHVWSEPWDQEEYSKYE